MSDIQQHSDPKVEALLARLSIDYIITWIPTGQLNWEATQALQTRDQFIDEDLVTQYADAMADGAKFPAVLAMPMGEGTYGLIGGVHRSKGWIQAGDEFVPAYVIDRQDATVVYLLSIEHNTTHGKPLTTAERCRHALALIDEHGMSMAEAARKVGTPLHNVQRARSVREYKRRAQPFGFTVSETKAIPFTGQHHLADALAGYEDTVFVEAVQTARNTKAGATGCIELAKRIRACVGDELAALSAIEDFETGYYTTDDEGEGDTPPTGKRNPAANMRAAARAFLEAATDDAVVDVDQHDLKITFDLMTKVAQRAVTIGERIR